MFSVSRRSSSGGGFSSRNPETETSRSSNLRSIRLSGRQLAEIVDSVLSAGASVRLCVAGESMRPLIRHGDLVTLSPMPPDVPTIGDVVAFRRPATGGLLIHRIVSIGRGVVRVQGDNSREPDGDVPLGALLGRVTRVEREGIVIAPLGRLRTRLIVALSLSGAIFWWNAFWSVTRSAGAWLVSQPAAFGVYRWCARSLSSPPVVSDARAEDEREVATLWGETRAPEGNGVLLVVRIRGCLAGFAVLSAGTEARELFGPVIRARYRGRGAGLALAQAAVVRAAQEGARTVTARLPHSIGPVKLASRVGFRPGPDPYPQVNGLEPVSLWVHPLQGAKET